MSNERLLLFKILEMSCLELTKLLSDTDILVGDYFHPKEWQGTLPFHNCAILHRDAPLNSTSPWGFIDLFDFSKGGRKFTHYNAQSHIIRFNPIIYPLPNNGTAHFATGSSGFQLITNLLDACHREGRCSFISNGASTNCKNSRRLVCHHLLVHRPYNAVNKVYKDLALRKRNKKSSLATSKRTLTGRPKVSENKCGANIVIKADETSFYVTIGNGCGMHQHHAPHDVNAITLPKRLIPTDVTNNIHQLGCFDASAQTIVSMSRHQYNCNITKRQVCNMAAFGRMQASLHEEGEIPGLSGPDQMIAYFIKMEIPHIVLSHHKDITHFEFQGDSLRNKTKKVIHQIDQNNKENRSNVDEEIATVTPNANGFVTMEHNGVNPTVLSDCISGMETHMNNMLQYGNDSRNSLNVPHDATILLSFVWCAKHCRRLFQAFPEVLYIDGTHATNRDRMPLFTVGIRDESFKIHVVIRAFVPNERAWIFRWLFQYGIPTLVGMHACQKVKLIVTDGDSQETSQLDAAINANIYGNAVRRRCGWHIIEKGTSFHLRCPSNTKDVIANMKLWVQESLMKNNETEDEYSR